MPKTITKRELRECTTPAQVFEECLLDIRDGLWVCNALTEENNENMRVAKPKGCAIGLVGINSGNCEIKFINAYEEDTSYDVYRAFFQEENANMWDGLGQKCALILAAALKEMNPLRYEEYEIPNIEGFQEYDVEEAEEMIIGHNDTGNVGSGRGGNLTQQQATEWFQKALEIASR